MSLHSPAWSISIPDFQTGHSTQTSRIQHFNQVWPQKVLKCSKFDESPSCKLYTAHSKCVSGCSVTWRATAPLAGTLASETAALGFVGWALGCVIGRGLSVNGLEAIPGSSDEVLPAVSAILPFYDLWRKSPFWSSCSSGMSIVLPTSLDPEHVDQDACSLLGQIPPDTSLVSFSRTLVGLWRFTWEWLRSD